LIGTWLHRGFKELVFLLAGLVALLLVAAAGLWWWAGTDGSLDWTLRQLAQSQPLQVEGVQGSLRSGMRVKRLLWERGGLKVEAFEVQLEWQPLALIMGTLRLDQAHAALVRVEDHRPPTASTVPRSLAIPLRVAVADLKVGRVEWAGPSSSFAATDLAADYRFTGSAHQVQLQSLRWGGGSYRGRANLGAGGALPLDASLEGQFLAAVPGGTAQLPLAFTASARGPLADLQASAALQVASGAASSGTRATATAHITPWAPQPIPQAQGDFRQLDLAALWPDRLPRTSLAGQVRLEPAGTATWTVSADLSNELAGPWDKGRLPLEKLSAQGEWRSSGQGLVRNLQARLGAGQLQAHGQWRGSSGWAVESQLKGVNPAALYSAMAPVPVSGRADLKGEGKAIAFDVDLKAVGAGADRAKSNPATGELAATVQAPELRQGSARGQWADGLLSLPAFDIRTADASLRGALELRPAKRAGSGRVSLEAPGLQARADGQLAEASGRGSVQLTVNNAAQALRWVQRLPAMPAALQGVALGGRGEAQIAWQGGWRDPAVQVRVASPMLELRSAAAAGQAPAVAKPTWVVRDALATIDGRLSDALLQVHGRAELGQRRLSLDLSGRGGRRSQAPALWQGQVAKLNVSASDPSLGTGTWTLSLRRPFDLHGSASSIDAAAGQASLTAPSGSAQRDTGGAAAAPAVLSWEPVRWRTGELHTAGRLTGLPMAWIALVGGPQLAGSALAGDMVFDAEWDASLGATPRLRATLARSHGDVTVLAETAEGTSTRVRAGVREASLSLVSEGEAVTLALKWDSERGGTADGQIATRLARGGAAGWYWPESAPLNGSLRAQLPRIGVWSLLAPPGWRLRGSLGADIAIAGTRAEPRLGGTLAADDLALRSVVDGVELQGGRLRARLDGQRLLIDEFMLRGAGGANGGGTLVATGEGAWIDAGPQVRISAQLTRLRASIRSDRQLTVSGRIVASLDASGTDITGNLKVDQAHILLPEESAPRLGDDVVVRGLSVPLTKTEARASEQAKTPASRRLKLAVDLDLGDDFRMQGHGIDTHLRGTLALTGQSITAPRLSGAIRAEGGGYQAYGQRLNIERGVLRFTGPIDNPSLDILAIRPNLTQRVGVQVTGSVLTPYVRLYSEPDMADAEKLSWLVLGHASATGGAEAALLQQAALALLASRSGTGKGGVAASLGLDELSFRRDGPDGPAITLGKRLGRNFYAAYERSLSGALGTLYVFYDLTKRTKLRAEAGERSAVDLIFTFSFD
jgi:translocation and assembly module TamB